MSKAFGYIGFQFPRNRVIVPNSSWNVESSEPVESNVSIP